MKPVLKLIAVILYTGAVFFAACKKEKPIISVVAPPQPPSIPPPPHIITAKIIEYGTGLPLASATVDVTIIPGPVIIHMTTDMNGECSFVGDAVGFRAFTKEGYWNPNSDNLFSLITLFPGNIRPDNNFYHSCDNFVVKLFPKIYLTIHLKDDLGLATCTDCTAIFHVNGLFTQFGINYTVNSGGNDYYIRMRPHIDTTFQWPVFGNMDNEFNIELDDGSYWNSLRRDTIFISNNSAGTLNISF